MASLEQMAMQRLAQNGTASVPAGVDCYCTPQKSRAALWIVAGLLVLAVVVIAMQAYNWRRISRSLDRKQLLKRFVKTLEKRAHALHWQQPLSQQCLEFCQQLEAVQHLPGNDERAHAFLIDKDGLVYAHGDATFLSHQGSERPGPYSIVDEDQASMKELIKLGKKGGGFYVYKWKKEKPLLAYTMPVSGTELFVGCAIADRPK